MSKTTIRGKGQITIPADIREAAYLEEGDPVEVLMVDEGILLRPQKVIDSTQAWFWSPEWQASIRRSLEQAQRGEGDVLLEDDFLGALDGE